MSMITKTIGVAGKQPKLSPEQYQDFAGRLKKAAEALDPTERESIMRTALLCDLIALVVRLNPKHKPPLFELLKNGKVIAYCNVSALSGDDLGVFMGAGYSFRSGKLEI
ncbi:MAG: hypothetical protein KJ725_14350 [Gammaproteobacteria bacterium]|nr:hypothetical protein [Gammaproteobacteria bacterium]